MQAVIFSFMIPVISLLLWRSYNREKKLTAEEMTLRYVAYTILVTLISTAVMVFLCEEGTSFWEKIDKSTLFVLKYAGIEILAAILVSLVEWICISKRIAVKLDMEEYYNTSPMRFVRKYVFPLGIYLLAIAVVVLNARLMFDNVLWGDEAFSANTAQKSMGGIIQVLYYWDNHPPLHYYWLKLFGHLFGFTVPVFHLASLVPFAAGLLLAVTALRKHFGNIPAAFFVVISGLASSCLEYNLEVRMYSLAFFAVTACFYCSYRVLCGGRAAWNGMVLWALVAAYSHYYALVAVGILLFITSVASWMRYRGKIWVKGIVSILLFVVGYLPWLGYLLTATENVSENWWMSDTLGLQQSLNMVFGSSGMSSIIFPLVIIFLLVMLLAESSVIEVEKKAGKTLIRIHTPSVRGWSDNTYAASVGGLTVFGTVLFAYLLCFIMGPVLAERYLYPLSAITFVVLTVECSHMLTLFRQLDIKLKKNWIAGAGKCALAAILAVLFAAGIKNYGAYSALVADEERKTTDTLYVIGEPEEDVALVTNGVQHLGWTVLAYYYPENEVVSGSYLDAAAESFWYFTPEFLTEEEIQGLIKNGYAVEGYGERQLSKYPFVLYYIEKSSNFLQ